ncbi:hypothetical protein LJC26_03430 [Desulfovibrio sp. OttesenSCG-928-O18]|nr:hypothetical protein [Desulfovibrio sp. OttesenSCG-928-O18]
MQRFYQGQLDFFCAVYAVVNALTALYGISLTQARTLFASILSDVSQHPGLWHVTLTNRTDFHWLVAHMLFGCGKGVSYPVRVFRPFMKEREIPACAADLAEARAFNEETCDESLLRPRSAAAIWAEFEKWLPETKTQPRAGTARRVALVRFHRYVRYVDEPVVSHWSVMDHREGGIFHLRDASKEENALYSLDKAVTVFAPELVTEKHNVRIEPVSVYFVERR